MFTFRSYSWFWGWGKERLTDQSTSSESAGIKDIEQDLKAQLHEARLKVAKVEAQISGAGKESVQETECYSLRFKVNNFRAFIHRFLSLTRQETLELFQ